MPAMRSTGRLVILLITAGVVAVVISGLLYNLKREKVDNAHAHLTAMDWFCQEFQISDDLRPRVEALHTRYFPECEDHCVHYADSLATLSKINEDETMEGSPEHVAAMEEHQQLRGESNEMFKEFIERVADELPPDQAERYLERMGSWLKTPFDPVH